MGKYDIKAKLDDECKLTLTDLIQELLEERQDTEKGTLNESAYRQAFENKKTGLISKIKIATGIDLNIYLKGENKEEKFDALKILKCFYEIEKDGDSKGKGGIRSNSKVRITNVLQNPSLDNIESIYTSESIYGDVFEDLYEKIKSQSKYAELFERILDNYELEWNGITHKVISYYKIWGCTMNPDPYEEWEELNKFKMRLVDLLLRIIKNSEALRENNYEKFRNGSKVKKQFEKIKKADKSEGGVMDRLFVVLKCHKLICMQVARCEIIKGSIEKRKISRDYIMEYKDCSDIVINEADWMRVIEYFDKYPQNISIDKFTQKIVDLILYGRKDLRRDELKQYQYAVRKVKKLIEILKEDGNILGNKDKYQLLKNKMSIQWGWDIDINNIEDYITEKTIDLRLIIAMVQEIFFITYNPFDKRKEDETIKVTYLGYTNKKQTLSSVLKKEDIKMQHPIGVLAWIKRIESRILINSGVPRIILMERKKAEEIILQIQKEICLIGNMGWINCISDYVITEIKKIMLKTGENEEFYGDI